MRKRRGSSSILVIMICVTIVVFGTFAVVSSANGKKLSKVNYNSAKRYYQLDGQAKEILSFISDFIYINGTEEEDFIDEVKLMYNNIEIEAVNESESLMVEFKLLPEDGKGISVYRKAEYNNDGSYDVLVSKALSREIEIDDSENFEIVE